MEVKPIITIASNAVAAKLVDPPRQVALLVSDWLSYEVDGYEQMKSKGLVKAGWDGRGTFYRFKSASFPAGFVHLVIRKLQNAGYQTLWHRKEPPAPLGEQHPVVKGFSDDPARQYQREVYQRLEKHHRMVGQLATGAGKSHVARLTYLRLKRKTLFLTTRGVLMYQMRDDFEKHVGERVGVLGDGEWSPCDGFNVGMVQTLSQRLEEKNFEKEYERWLIARETAEKKEREQLVTRLRKAGNNNAQVIAEAAKLDAYHRQNRPDDDELGAQLLNKVNEHNARRLDVIKLLASFEFLILEEAHEAGGTGYYDVSNACNNAHYRLALTGTPFMRPDGESNMRLMAVSGPVGIKVTEQDLINKGILARPIFLYSATPRPKMLFPATSWPRSYEIGIVENEGRNALIVQNCLELCRRGLTSMILIQRKKHGELLKSALKSAGMRVEFIYGEHDQAARKKALGRLGDGSLDVLIGTNILDVGVDVPSVGAVFLAGGGKAEIATRQRIGRGLRAKKSGPNVCFIFDFMDEHNKTLLGHALERRQIILNTPGFAENLLPREVTSIDFDFYGFPVLPNKTRA